MRNSIRKTLSELRSHTGGNAMLLMALGMPALIGGAGLAVDTAQWYMWKRELQFAVDQSALAGAWARTDSDTLQTYQDRATQEYRGNLSSIASFAGAPVVGLANYAGGNSNSVTVSATVTKALPFSNFLTGQSASITARAQAQFEEAQTYTSCMVATDPDDSGAVTINGNVTITARCGLAALSSSPSSIIRNGQSQNTSSVDVGWVLSMGGIDDWFDGTDVEVHEYMDNLVDPFAGLSPPTGSSTVRTATCATYTTTTVADTSIRTVRTYSYKKGSNANNATAYNYTGTKLKTNSDATVTTTAQVVANTVTAGTFVSGPNTTVVQIEGSGSNKIYEVKVETITSIYSNVIVSTGLQGALQPGTYYGLAPNCPTVFSPGIYVIDGQNKSNQGLEINGQTQVTGAGVMFVLKNGAFIKINGGANINLTAMTVAQLEQAGVSASQASLLNGMLVFEDRNSTGSRDSMINGNAATTLNGSVYLSKSNLNFSGTANVTSQCLMLVSGTITISGNVDMESFCPDGVVEDTEVASGSPSVKLVA